jgi:hypothetical protein
MNQKIFLSFLFCYPVIYLIGGTLFLYQLILIPLGLSMILKRYYSFYELLLLIFIAFTILILLVINSVEQLPSNRLLAAINNITIFIVGVLFYFSLNKHDFTEGNQKLLLNSISFMIISVVFLAFLGLFFIYNGDGSYEYNIPSIFAKVMPKAILDINLIYDAMMIKLVVRDWFFGQAFPRFSMLTTYPNALSILMLMLVSLFFYLKKKINYIVLILGLIIITLTWSRTIFMAIIFATFVFVVLRARFSLIILFFLALLLPFMSFLILDYASAILSFREGSSESRLSMYGYAVKNMDLLDLLIGHGVKERIDLFKFPLGSHSTYLGFIYKYGLLGSSFFLLFVLFVVKDLIFLLTRCQSIDFWIFLPVFSCLFWMIFEDIDTPIIVTIYFFICIFLLTKRKKELTLEEIKL